MPYLSICLSYLLTFQAGINQSTYRTFIEILIFIYFLLYFILLVAPFITSLVVMTYVQFLTAWQLLIFFFLRQIYITLFITVPYVYHIPQVYVSHKHMVKNMLNIAMINIVVNRTNISSTQNIFEAANHYRTIDQSWRRMKQNYLCCHILITYILLYVIKMCLFFFFNFCLKQTKRMSDFAINYFFVKEDQFAKAGFINAQYQKRMCFYVKILTCRISIKTHKHEDCCIYKCPVTNLTQYIYIYWNVQYIYVLYHTTILCIAKIPQILGYLQ
eukprot:TRINITY_DN3726_c1_g2_i1.p2 TRINITY_DN3726_c1_g2~~TRINITY_DN3726_c1_g2_i1.p2  ORF type:complete len:272 (-),score=-29.82 TRINITY_DN3726_c1_g2_i1:343-1158(-)